MEQTLNEAIEKLERNELSLNDLLDILTDIQLIIA